MKIKSLLIVCLLIFVLVLSSCDVDLYKNKRPIDDPGSIWVCDGEGYYFTYYVDDHVNDEYQSYFSTNETEKTFVRFLWNQYDSGVVVYEIDEKNGQEKMLLAGKCVFDKNMFQITLSYVSETAPDLPEVLCFEKSIAEN